jgi:RHS repeat-associated protein
MTATINGTAKNQAFSYDNVGRLVTATGSGWQRRFAYDRWGNRTGVWNAVTGGTQIQSVTLQQPGGVTNNRIASVSGLNYVYDNGGAGTGNVTNDGAHSYQYDGENRLVKVDNGSTAVNTYDAANRRVKKVSAAGTTWYVWEGGQVIAEYGAVPVGASNIRYYHPDRLSTRMITDESGGVAGTQDHLPFGEDAGVTGENEKHRFTNYERDAESGTDYAVNRQYANSTGRFLRPDPVSGSTSDPQSLNRYAYSLNDPINLADPLGLRWLTVTRCYTTGYTYTDSKGNTISDSKTVCETEDVWIPEDSYFYLSLAPIGGVNLQQNDPNEMIHCDENVAPRLRELQNIANTQMIRGMQGYEYGFTVEKVNGQLKVSSLFTSKDGFHVTYKITSNLIAFFHSHPSGHGASPSVKDRNNAQGIVKDPQTGNPVNATKHIVYTFSDGMMTLFNGNNPTDARGKDRIVGPAKCPKKK